MAKRNRRAYTLANPSSLLSSQSRESATIFEGVQDSQDTENQESIHFSSLIDNEEFKQEQKPKGFDALKNWFSKRNTD